MKCLNTKASSSEKSLGSFFRDSGNFESKVSPWGFWKGRNDAFFGVSRIDGLLEAFLLDDLGLCLVELEVFSFLLDEHEELLSLEDEFLLDLLLLLLLLDDLPLDLDLFTDRFAGEIRAAE